jgi:putative FmdB family regulatory protein
MPTYAYVCAKCGDEFEKIQSIKDKPLAVCPKDLCRRKKWGRGRVTRKIGTGGGLIFKGSGFYATDYRSEKYKAAAKQESGAASSSASPAKSSATPASESKPAKPETKPGKSAPTKS